jgi:hypothetical protein
VDNPVSVYRIVSTFCAFLSASLSSPLASERALRRVLSARDCARFISWAGGGRFEVIRGDNQNLQENGSYKGQPEMMKKSRGCTVFSS